MTYPLKFRERVLTLKKEERLSYAQTAKRFKVGVTTLQRWEKKIEPEIGRNKPSVKIDMEALRKDVEQYPDSYQKERAARFGVSPTGIRHALRRLQVTRKKNPTASTGRHPCPSRLSGKNKPLEKRESTPGVS